MTFQLLQRHKQKCKTPDEVLDSLTKFNSKAQMRWEVSKEQEEEFRKSLPEDYNELELDELFKLIRGAEYRRGKEDGIKEYKKECQETLNNAPNRQGEDSPIDTQKAIGKELHKEYAKEKSEVEIEDDIQHSSNESVSRI